MAGFVAMHAEEAAAVVDGLPFSAFTDRWNDLPLDEELARLPGGGAFRLRRFGRFLAEVDGSTVTGTLLPHGTFQQDARHIPLFAGRQRTFAPVSPELAADPVLAALIGHDVGTVSALTGTARWVVNIHQIRVVARSGGSGLPTPEGRHRDGHAFVGMHLLRRERCQGGESIVYRDGQPDVRLMLRAPLDALIVDDAAITHEVTPISAAGGEGGDGIRDMLLVDLNPAGGQD